MVIPDSYVGAGECGVKNKPVRTLAENDLGFTGDSFDFFKSHGIIDDTYIQITLGETQAKLACAEVMVDNGYNVYFESLSGKFA